MDQKSENRRRLNPRTIAIIVLALVVLAEGAFLLLHRRSDDAGSADAAASTAAESADGSETADPQESGSDTEQDPSAEKGEASPDNQQSGGAQPPAQTPTPSIPPENTGKAYAGAIAALANYAKAPNEATLGYLLGGELLGDQMQIFLPALLGMSGQGVDALRTEMDAALGLPAGTTSLTITGEQALPADEISAARERLRTIEQSFSAIVTGFSEYTGYSDSDWASIGSQLGISGAEAKRMISDLTTSSKTMEGLLVGSDISEGYLVTLKTNSGATMQTNVYCISGKWVTTAFFNMEFT